MSEPSRPDRGAVDPDPSSARTEPSVRLTSQTIAAPADDVLPPDRTASAAGPGPDASADTVSSADDGLGLKAAEVLASMIADPARRRLRMTAKPRRSSSCRRSWSRPSPTSCRARRRAGWAMSRDTRSCGCWAGGDGGRLQGPPARAQAHRRAQDDRYEGHHNPSDLARFRSEAMAVAELQHPNIVQIYEVGEDNGRPFFSLEYVAGESLARKIAGTPRPPAESARLVRPWPTPWSMPTAAVSSIAI